MKKIYNLGSLNIDYVYAVHHMVAPGETISSPKMEVFPGGKGLNQSVAIARAGGTVIHGGALGQDGAFLAETMREAGVDTARIRRMDEATGHAVIQIDRNGQNSILIYGDTNRAIDRAYIEGFLSDGAAGDILLVQNETSGVGTAIELAHAKGMQIALNPSPFDETIRELPLSCVTWWFCNEIEGAALFGAGSPDEIAARFAEVYPQSNLILTLGGEGSLFQSADRRIRQPSYPTTPVDTTAAGDTFTGYFLSAVALGEDVATALKTASQAASITVSRMGASVSIPDRAEVAETFRE